MEVGVYRLGGRIGSRNEIVSLPAVEVLGYLALYQDEEQAKSEAQKEDTKNNWWTFWNMLQLSQPLPDNIKDRSSAMSKRKKAIEQLEEVIKPDGMQKKVGVNKDNHELEEDGWMNAEKDLKMWAQIQAETEAKLHSQTMTH